MGTEREDWLKQHRKPPLFYTEAELKTPATLTTSNYEGKESTGHLQVFIPSPEMPATGQVFTNEDAKSRFRSTFSRADKGTDTYKVITCSDMPLIHVCTCQTAENLPGTC